MCIFRVYKIQSKITITNTYFKYHKTHSLSSARVVVLLNQNLNCNYRRVGNDNRIRRIVSIEEWTIIIELEELYVQKSGQ